MSFNEKYMERLNNVGLTTVLVGSGKFLEYETDEIYEIHSIKIPFTTSGKHITVYSKDDKDVVEDREYFDGMIISFNCEKIECWQANF